MTKKKKGLSDNYKEKIGVAAINNLQHAPELFMKGALAYMGFKREGNWRDAMLALVMFELAKSGNMFAGATGVAGLGILMLGEGIASGTPFTWEGFFGQFPSVAQVAAGMPPIPYPVDEEQFDWYPFKRRPK